jgi:hypothetical protein
MPRAHLGLLPPKLLDPENEFGYVVRCWPRAWCTGNIGRIVVRGFAGEILSPLLAQQPRSTQPYLEFQHTIWIPQVSSLSPLDSF